MEIKLQQINNKLIDRIYLGLMIFLLPVLCLSLSRMFLTGWQWIYLFHIIFAFASSLIFVFRSKISVRVKTHFLCTFFVLICFIGGFKFGISGGFSFCVLSVMIVTLIYGKRIGYLYFIVAVTGISILGYLYSNKIIKTVIDLNVYNSSIGTWVFFVFGLSWLLIICIYGIHLFYDYFQKSIQELKKANSELNRFVYSTSHDLRAPLKSMLGIINIAKSDSESTTTVQLERLAMLDKSVLKLDNFIEDILNYYRNKSMEIEREEIDLEKMIQEIRGSQKLIEETRRIKFYVEVNSEKKVVSDRSRLTILLSSVISNAIQYSDPSRENSYVKVNINCNKEKVFIVIDDNGIGIAPEDHEKIFEMFYRASTLSTGSGLGLYIVKEILGMLSGKIELESELGKGTKITIEIPNQVLSW